MGRPDIRSLCMRVVFGFTLSLLTVLITGGIIYGLYRVAIFDKAVYGIIFTLAAAAFIGFAVYRAVRVRKLRPFLVKCAHSLTSILTVLLLISGVMGCGAFIMRMPLAGSLSVIPLGLFFYFIYRVRLFARIRALFHEENAKDR